MSATPGKASSYEGENIMAAKKKTSTTTDAGLQTLRIGSRVRCTDDGVEGRIVWANGVSVKIKWDDDEQVTWRRDSLAGRPVEILDADEQSGADGTPAAAKPPAAETPPVAPEAAQEPPAAVTPADEATSPQTPPVAPGAAPTAEPPSPVSEPAVPATDGEPSPAAAKPKRQRKAPAEPKKKKLSALDAAAKVLAETGQPMSCQEMIGAMAAKGYWSSPGGKTPAATPYSAIQREIAAKGDQSRFTKAGPGRFARRGA
jgi:hypothetical protein